MNSPKHALFIPGFGEKIHEPTCKEIESITNLENVDPFTLKEALKNPEKIARAAKNALVVVHSAGLLALSHEMSPSALGAFNTPNPRGKKELFLGAVNKTNNHLKNLLDPDTRQNTLGVLTGGTDGFLHPVEMYKLLCEISEFDSNKNLKELATNNPDISIHCVFAENDEIYPNSDAVTQEAHESGLVVIKTTGGHDAIYTDPGVLKKGLENIQF